MRDRPTIEGRPHVREDGRECRCGCQWVGGERGELVKDGDTPKLAALDPPMGYFAFEPAYHGRIVVAYTLEEIVISHG